MAEAAAAAAATTIEVAAGAATLTTNSREGRYSSRGTGAAPGPRGAARAWPAEGEEGSDAGVETSGEDSRDGVGGYLANFGRVNVMISFSSNPARIETVAKKKKMPTSLMTRTSDITLSSTLELSSLV